MSHDSPQTRQEAIDKLNKLIHGIHVAMLTTLCPDGSLRGRPMATQEIDPDGDLWFFTEAASPKSREIQREQHVNVAYVNHDKNHYVSVSGLATMIHDRQKIKQLWNPFVKIWFPDGPDDPNLALLKVHIESAEYWDSASSTLVKLGGFIKAMVTGKRVNPGEDVKLQLNQPGESIARPVNSATPSEEPAKKQGDPLGSAAKID